MFIPTIVALLVLASTVAAASPRPQLVLLVRQETKTPLSAEMLRRVGAEVNAIWGRYVDVRLQSASSLEPYRSDDLLRVVLTDRQTQGPDAAALGWIEFVNGEPSKTIVVSLSAAQALVAEGRWSGRLFSGWPPELTQTFLIHAVGRAMAHELGHYLLRTKQHTAAGLMRARFTIDEIMDHSVHQFQLRPSEAAQLGAGKNSVIQNSEFRILNACSEHLSS